VAQLVEALRYKEKNIYIYIHNPILFFKQAAINRISMTDLANGITPYVL
jgi:hypothetical protein